MLQNATPLRKSAPLYCACHRKCIFADPLQMSHACHHFWKCYKTLTFCSLLTWCTIPCTCHAKRHLNVQKWPEPLVFNSLTWTCAPRRNGVHFFDISTSKSGPNLVCFLHFDFEMCFAPQRRALFRHCNSKKCFDAEVFLAFSLEKWSEREVFLAFSLPNVLRATMACTFSTSQLLKVLRS